MAINKKPVQTSRRKRVARLMDNQDDVARGDSKAIRTARMSISTTDEVVEAVTNAAHDRRISRSRLVEEALAEYLNLTI